MQSFWIHGIVWCPEVMACALIDVIVLNVESCALEVEIDVDAGDWVVAYLGACLLFLEHELRDDRGIVGCIVFCEELDVASQFAVEDFGYLEIDVEIVIERECREGQYVLVGSGLERDVVFQMENAELEVLTQVGSYDLYVVAALEWADIVGHSRASIGEIGIVLDVFDAYCKLGSCLGIGEYGFYLTVVLLVHVVVPPCMFRMVMAEEIGWFLVAYEGVDNELGCVGLHWQIEFATTCEGDVTRLIACNVHFSIYIVMYHRTLCSDELSSDDDVVFLHFMTTVESWFGTVTGCEGVGHLIAVVLECHIGVETSCGIFVESFTKGESEGVSH